MKKQFIAMKQMNITILIGCMSIRELSRYCQADVYTEIGEKEDGYLFGPDKSRTEKMARYLKSAGLPLTPTTVLLSYRGQLVDSDPIDGVVTVEIPEGKCFWIIDGQHRIEGFKFAIEEYGLKRLWESQLPVVILDRFKQVDEANVYLVLNDTMKRNRTDRAHNLLVSKKYGDEWTGITKIYREEGRMWEIKSSKICAILNQDENSRWRGRIQLANEESTERHAVRELSFNQSLKLLSNKEPYKNQPAMELAELLKRYWDAWKETVKFEAEDCNKYVLWKSTGVFVCNALLVDILKELIASNIKSPSVENFSGILKRLGDPTKLNPNVIDYLDGRYWEINNATGAALAGGMKGYDMIRKAMAARLYPSTKEV